jgi:hypothetical protein
MKPTFEAVFRAGMGLLGLTLLLAFTFPRTVGPLPQGLSTPILALELVRTRAEVSAILRDGEGMLNADWQLAFDRGNSLDYAVLVAYGAFLTLFARALATPRRRFVMRSASLLALIGCCADGLENTRLFMLTGGDANDSTLRSLALFTWTKWSALAFAFLLLAPAVASVSGWLGRACAVVFVLPVPLVAAGFLLRGVWAEAMMHLVMLCFGLALLLAFRERSAALSHGEV